MSEISAPSAAIAASGEVAAHSQHKAVRRLSPAASSTKESSVMSKESDRSLGEPVFVVSKSGPSWIHGRDLGFATTKSTSSDRSTRGQDRSTTLDDGVDSCTADTETTIDRSGVDYWRQNHNSPHKMTSGNQRTSHERQTDMDSDQDSNASVASWPLLPDEKRRSQLRLSTMIMIEPEKSHSGLKEKALASARNSLTGDPSSGMGFSGFLPPFQPRDQTPVEELLGSKEFPFPPYTEVGAAGGSGEGRGDRDWQNTEAQHQAIAREDIVAFDDINFGPAEDWSAVRSSSARGERVKELLHREDKIETDAQRVETSASNARSWPKARAVSSHHARPLVLPQVTATSEARKRSKRSTNILSSSGFLKHAPLEGSARLCHEFVDSVPGLPICEARVPSPAHSLVAAGGDDWLEQRSTSSEDDSMYDEDLINAPNDEPEIVQVKTVKKSISRAEALLFVGRSPVSETRHFQEAGVQTTATGKGPESLLDNGRRRPRPQLTITIDNRAPANSPKRQVWHATCPACGHDIHLDAPYVSDPASALSATPTPPLSAKMLAQARVDARAAQRAPAPELYQQQFEQLQSAVDDVQTSPSWRASQQSGRSRSTLSSSASGIDSGRSKWSLEETNRPARVLALVDRCATSGRSSTSDSEHRTNFNAKSNIVGGLFKSKLSDAPAAMTQRQRPESEAATTHVAERPSSRASSIASSLAAFSIGSRRTDLASRGSTSCSGGPTSALIESYVCDSSIGDAEVAVESISTIPSMSQPAFQRPQTSSVSATSSAACRAGSSESLPSTPGPLCVQHELPSSFDTETQVTNEVCPWEDDVVTPHRNRLSDSFDAPLPRTPANNAKALKLLGIGSGAAADIAMIASANDSLIRRTSISNISTPYEAAHIGGASGLSESQFIGGFQRRTHAARNSSTTDLTTTLGENATPRRIQAPKSSTALTTEFQGHGGSAMGDIQQSMGKLKSALKKTSKLAVPSNRQGLRSGSSSSLNSANGPAGGSSGSGAGSASGTFTMQGGDSGISGPLHSMKMPLAITENGLQVGAEALAFRLPSLDLANDARPMPNTSVSSNFPMRGTIDTAVEDNSSNWGVLMQTNEYFTTTTVSPPSRTAKDLPPYPGLESSNDDHDMWLSGTQPDENTSSSSLVESEWQNPHPYASSAHVNPRVPAASQDLASIWSATTQPLPRQKWE